jgi:hypothetical protein
MRSLARTPVRLKGIYWGSDMRLFLRGAEVWLGTEYLGVISAEWLEAAVERELADMALTKRFQLELEPHRLGARTIDAPPPPRDFKATRREQRRARRKKSL